jgi:glucose/arabinose dehydrogenase
MRRRPHLVPPGSPSAAVLSLALAAAFPAAPAGAQPGGWTLGTQLVTGGLTQPVGIAHADDGSGRLFIVERMGVIRIWNGVSLLPEPFLDVSALVDPTGPEQGLLGLAFHPDYETNGFFYIDYTRDPGAGLDRTVVARYQVSGVPDVADPNSALVLFEIEQPAQNHNGGDLHFGPDGFLYISSGDGGGAPQNGQLTDTLLGKILRLDVDAAPGPGLAYAIPPDNPFAGVAGARGEIWAYGLRNPWRFSFDRALGDLWIGDVGQNAWEEVDVARAEIGGTNFGWNRMEGAHCFRPISGCEDPALALPVTEYSHDVGGCTVIGGGVYRGTDQPLLAGGYLFGDYCSGLVWAIDPASEGPVEPALVGDTGATISSFGEDEAGEMYVTDLRSGELLKLTAAAR